MSADFSIIPVSNAFLNVANEIKDRLELNAKLTMNITIDTQYDLPLNYRISQFKKMGDGIVVIEQDYDETGSIRVLLPGKGSSKHRMEINEFVDLILSFEDDEADAEEESDGSYCNIC